MNVFVLTGAGVSAESGVPTFRDAGGLWEQHSIYDLATLKGFLRNRTLVRRFYNARRRALANVKPNAAHHALARLEAGLTRRGGALFLCTQNVDDLHERGGARIVIHMHGELAKACCVECSAVMPWKGDMEATDTCLSCGRANALRPHVVWFGEVPFAMERIEVALDRADLFAAIGTSGTVAPASTFATRAQRAGACTIEINLEASETPGFAARRIGPASTMVPQWVEELLGEPSLV